MKKHKDCCCLCSSKKIYSVESTQELLQLMELYLSEYKHRDHMFWSQAFRYFFASFAVMIFPWVFPWERVNDQIDWVHWVFPIFGIILSFVFFLVVKGYAMRLEAIGRSYQNLIDRLPKSMRRIRLEELQERSPFFKNSSKSIIEKRGVYDVFRIDRARRNFALHYSALGRPIQDRP